jgi:small nuclear ribonucleoprotein (snRNP)-like protein
MTRSHRNLHSRCHAIIRAFDKHLNLWLLDVTEEFAVRGRCEVRERQRKKGRRKGKGRGDGGDLEDGDVGGEGEGRRWEWVDVERDVCVWRQRYVSQMLLRGPSVISVSRYVERDKAQPVVCIDR